MKKSYLALIISVLVLATTILWLTNAKTNLSLTEIIQFSIILVLIGFGLYLGLSHLKSEKRGELTEDELSKKIIQKASSNSFYISLYLWLAVMYFSDKTKLEQHTLTGAGILGMAVIFCACFIYYKIWGTKDV
jgi:hypothetical protein